MVEGQVLWGSQNIYAVQVPTIGNGPIVECRIKGKKLFLNEEAYNPLAPGDWVQIELDTASKQGMIVDRLKRSNALERWNRKREASQTLVANIDLLIIVACVTSPPFRPRFVDRCLALAEYSHLKPLIVINKADLGVSDEDEARILNYAKMGYEVLLASVIQDEGIKELKERIAGLLVAFIGQSGVGKSSLLLALDPEIKTKVGIVNKKYQRGIHTTTLARCWPVDFARGIIDTPGIRQLEIPHFEPQNLALMFIDIAPHAKNCQLYNCQHRDEPECAVVKAVEDGLIFADRYQAYRRIIDAEED